MTIVVFLVDTSASMNQRTYLGTSLLDLAKAAIESFLKIRARDQTARGMDRYMLLTFEDSPNNVKAGWRESQATFQTELRNLTASGLTELGPALGNALQLLNINRLQSGIDNYGQGRYPHWLEPAVILTFTDGDRLSPSQQNPNPKVISVPPGPSLGSELTLEPFRWDQRIFGILLRLPGHQPRQPWQPNQMIPSDASPLDAMCEVTGGRSYCIRTHKALNQCLESLAAKMQSGIVVTLEKMGPDPPPSVAKEEPISNGYPEPKASNGVKTEGGLVNGLHGKESGSGETVENEAERSWDATRRMLYVPRTLHKGYQGFWPMPEAFWPNIQASTLPARSAHPLIRFSCEPVEPAVLPDFPWDKYELEPSPLTLNILSRRQPNVAWEEIEVFVEGSGRDANSIVSKTAGPGAPFGYLKAASDGRSVNLVLLPYNYPVLFPLIEELRTKLKGKVSGSWRLRFDAYLKGTPPYYFEPLRKALARVGLASVMPDRSQDMVFSYSVSNYLQRVKYRSKEEFERMNAMIHARIANERQPNTHQGVPLLRPPGMESGKDDKGGRVFLRHGGIRASGFRNAFDIPRSSLIRQISRMRVNLSEELGRERRPSALDGGLPGSRLSLAAAELLHQLPVAHMGSYQEYLTRQHPPLRELEAAPIRTHAFGNPFKIDKNLKNVDEINLDGPAGALAPAASPGSGALSRGPKRGDLSKRPSHHKRRGLPKGYKYKRRRVDSETGEVLSDSGWETDSSEAGSPFPSPSTSPIPPPTLPLGSPPPRKKAKMEIAVASAPAEIGTASVSNENIHTDGDLFRDKTRERKSRVTEKEGSHLETKAGLTQDALQEARRSIAATVRSTGPLNAKVRRLRDLWEWGVSEARDRAALLDFAIQEAHRFKAASLLAHLLPAREALTLS